MWWGSCRTKNAWANPYTFELPFQQLLRCHNVYTDFAFCFFFRHIGSHAPQEVVQRQLVCSDQSLIGCFIIRPLTECVHWSSTWMSDRALKHEPRQPEVRRAGIWTGKLLVAMAPKTLLTVHRACCRVPEHITAVIELHLVQCLAASVFFFYLACIVKRRWRVRVVNSTSERHPVAVWRPKYMFWASSYGISVVIVACDSKSISVLLSFDIEGYSQCESYYLATAMDLFAFTFFEMLIRCPLSLQDTNTQGKKKKMGLKTDTCVSLVLAAAARVACWGLATQLLLLAAKVWCLLRAAQKPRWGKMDRGPLGKSWVESNKPSFGLAPLGSSCGHWMFADDRADRAHCALHYAQWLLCKKTLYPCPWPEVPGFSQTVRLSNFFHGKTYPYAICC